MKTQQPDDLRLDPIPRPVPWSLRLYLGLQYGQPALFFLGMGLAAFIGFALHSDVKSVLFALPTRSAEGTVTTLRDTGDAEGGTHHSRGTPVYAVSYTYVLPGGSRHRGVSFATGTWTIPSLDEDGDMADDDVVGRRVPVQYVAQYPGVSRIRGLRSNIFGIEGLFSSVFLAVGLLLTWSTLVYWRRLCAALARGEQDPETGNVLFPDGKATRSFRTKGRTLADASKPAPPDRVVLKDMMTGATPVRDGRLQPPGLRALLLVCLLPTLMLLLVIATVRHS